MSWLAVSALQVVLAGSAAASVWQFSIANPNGKGRTFLWIPPSCRQVRGVVLAQQVILEKVALEDPVIRQAAAAEDLALALVIPACIGEYDEKGGGAQTLQKILDGLADVSGYGEISQAPLLPIGHSGGAIWAWNTAYWDPGRCFGVVGLKSAPIHPPAYAPKANVDGVPILAVTGQYESWGVKNHPADWHWHWVRGTLLEFRAIGVESLMSELVEPGVTHFGWDNDLAAYVAAFMRKAAHYRIPAELPSDGQPVRLNHLALSSGWLTDITLMTPPRYPAALYEQYAGDPTLAFWNLDEELARANEAYGATRKNKELQEVTFVEDGKPLPTAWLEDLKFEPQSDGMTVKVAADFLHSTPPEMSYPHPRALGHANGPILFRLIGGWHGSGEQTGPDTFRIKLDRFFFSRPWGSMMIMAYQPGDDRYAYAEQAAGIKFPPFNKAGRPQEIAFAPIADQHAGAGPIPLHASSDADLPVEFCVIDGPAEIEGHTLKLTQIPPRTKMPAHVTVTAYQWGRSIEPLVQSAKPVEETFSIFPAADPNVGK
jgi:hypothetical protein